MKKIISALVIISVLILAVGCGKDGKPGNTNAKDDMTKEVNLTWYIPVTPGEQAMNIAKDYIKQKLNVNMKFVVISFSDYEAKMQVLNASNEKYDIAFTSSWCNNYYKNVVNGTIMPIDDLLKNYAPNTLALMGKDIWDLSRINGKLYGVINQQIMARGPCLIIPERNVELLGLNLDEFKTYKDTEKYLRAVKQKSGNYTYVSEIWANWISTFGFEEFIGQKIPGAIRIDGSDNDFHVVNQYETEEFKEYIKWRAQMVKEGLTPPNMIKMDNAEIAYQTGDDGVVRILHASPTYKPGIEAEIAELPNNLGKMITFSHQTPYVNTYSVTATMNSIGASSNNPERAMMLLELINTDKELFNLFANGIENVDYEKIGENKIEKIPTSKFYCDSWAVGNTFNSYVNNLQPDNIWEETRKLNEKSIKSPLNGFSPNIEPVKVQISNCTATVGEFLAPLDAGIVDVDDSYPKFISKLKAAGVDDVIAEMQKQIDEWKKNK